MNTDQVFHGHRGAERHDPSVARTILDQLGNRFVVTTGAWSFASGPRSLSFRLGSNPRRVSSVVIELAADDTYTVKLFAIRGYDVKKLAETTGIYCDQLAEYLGNETGLAITLGGAP